MDNTYNCTKCGAQAAKSSQATESKGRGKAPVTDQQTLGTWHCPKCGKVPVRREKK